MEGATHQIAMETAEPSPAWDVGRAQRAVYDLEMAGRIGRDVLEVGCGIGEQALFLAARGHLVCGIDRSEVAIARAQRHARERQLPALFVAGELGALGRLRRRFDTIVDVGDLHRVAVAERATYAASLRALTAGGGQLYLWCFADHERAPGGPPRIAEGELRARFAFGWRIEAIEPARIESHTWPGGAHAWFLSATAV
jgi:cyclopropane fatty-acyl-phospholipid synthase-like methyltransferase